MAISQQDPRIDIGNEPEWHTEYSAPAPPPARRPSHRHNGASRGWLAASAAVLLAVVAVGATVPPSAPAHQLWTTAAGTITQAPADPQVAIQAVIQQANSEQAQALATGNPAVMSDTATAAYYRQLVQQNQGLATQARRTSSSGSCPGVPSASTEPPRLPPPLRRGSRRSATGQPPNPPMQTSTRWSSRAAHG